jgi:hypothetical protein
MTMPEMPKQARLVVASVALIAGCLEATGCYTLERPKGEWATALDLDVPGDALADLVVNIDCGSADTSSSRRSDTFRPGIYEGCRKVAELTRELGADVQAVPGLLPDDRQTEAEEDAPAPEGAAPPVADFTLRYVDLGGHRDYGGWTLPVALFTFSFFPCIEDIETAAELQLRDAHGLIFARYPLHLDLIKIYGVAALYYDAVGFVSPARLGGRKSRSAASLRRYVANILYTYRQRLDLSNAATAQAAP